jgi:hypothetical protein
MEKWIRRPRERFCSNSSLMPQSFHSNLTTESESAVCRQKVTDAVRRMNDFLLDGVIPDDLK